MHNSFTRRCTAAMVCLGIAGFATHPARGNSAVAWGANDSGQLGDGNTTNSSAPTAINGMSSGVAVIAAGGIHSLAIQNGSVGGWGSNANGQLGTATPSIIITTNTSLQPTRLNFT